MMLPSDQENHLGSARTPLSGGSSAPPDDLAFVLAASWVSPSIARERLDTWLRSHRWPAAQREDMVLALSEAVSNSIEHGYGVGEDALPTGDMIAVTASVVVDGARRVLLTVHDDGVWRTPGPRSPHRGHGLSVMRACGDGLEIDHGPGRGTTVTFMSRPAPTRVDVEQV